MHHTRILQHGRRASLHMDATVHSGESTEVCIATLPTLGISCFIPVQVDPTSSTAAMLAHRTRCRTLDLKRPTAGLKQTTSDLKLEFEIRSRLYEAGGWCYEAGCLAPVTGCEQP